MESIIDKMNRISCLMHDEDDYNWVLSLDRMDKASDELNELCRILDLTPVQVILLTAIIQKSASHNFDGEMLARSLNINYLRLLGLKNEVDNLKKRGYIYTTKEKSYRVSRDALNCLVNNKPFTPEPTTGLDANDILIRIKNALNKLKENQLTNEEVVDELEIIMNANSESSVAREVLRINKLIPYFESVILYGLIIRYYYEDTDRTSWYDIDDYFSADRLAMLRVLYKNKGLALQKNDIIENAGAELMNKDFFKIKDEIKSNIFADLGEISTAQVKVTATKQLKASEIIPKQLFYNQNVNQQIQQLKELMSVERYYDIRTRMKNLGYRTGFTCLFYGSPGTGKTETAYQIARESGRDILMVDVSQIKSCWVGESEKNITSVFSRYRDLVNKSDKTPILLFNEADAILGRRNISAERSTDKMMNSIQNIILQGMEDLDGILIATTNITDNLDKAFERRFLYKIQFDKPSLEVRASIWRSMIPELDSSDAMMLADRYCFSGGQIENIARKREIQSIINASKPGINDICIFCAEESIDNNSNRRRIGF